MFFLSSYGENIESIKNEISSFNVVFVDVNEDMAAIKRFNISAIPTQIIITNEGQELYRHMGVLDKEKIKEMIKNFKIVK